MTLTGNPYVGPRSFKEKDEPFFFGRDSEARDLLARINSERMLLFYAQSGTGKSSLIHTRIIPGLRDVERFFVLPVGRVSGELPPGVKSVDNIFTFNLINSLDQSGGESNRLARVPLNDFLARLVRKMHINKEGRRAPCWVYNPDFKIEQPADGAKQQTSGPRFALFIDQFEEIITSHPDRWQEREIFFNQLNQALVEDPNLWVILTLREDYVAALDPYAPLLFNRLFARFYMERMGKDAALMAVREPAKLAGRTFESGVAETLVDKLRQVTVPGRKDTVAGQYVEPLQLQVVCKHLWDNLNNQDSGTEAENDGSQSAATSKISKTDLAKAGDVDLALENYYVQSLADEAVQKAGVTELELRRWFTEELITKTGTDNIRSAVLQNEVTGQTGSIPNVVANKLAKRFLLRKVVRGRDAWVELGHDRYVEPILHSNSIWFAQLPHIELFQVTPPVVTQGMEITIDWTVENGDKIILLPDRKQLEEEDAPVRLQSEETLDYRLEATSANGITEISDARPVLVVQERIEKERILDATNAGQFSFVLGPEFDKVLFFDLDPAAENGRELENPLDSEDKQRISRASRLQRLLGFLQEDVGDSRSAIENEDWPSSNYLTTVAAGLGLAKPATETTRTLMQLAQSPVSVYLVAGIHPFIEAALVQAGKSPRSETYRRPRDPGYQMSYLDQNPAYSPIVDEPLVFHMFGIDRFPQSLLLTEDDCLKYLMLVSEDRERIPVLVRYVLVKYFQAIIGYDIDDWSFKTFWHGVDVENRDRSSGGFVQVQAKTGTKEADILRIEAYLGRHKNDTLWGTMSDSINWLHKTWTENGR